MTSGEKEMLNHGCRALWDNQTQPPESAGSAGDDRLPY